MYETLPIIQKLAQERFELFLRAGHQQLTPAEHQRLEVLDAQIPMLWHQHRAEVAARAWSHNKVTTFTPKALLEAA